MRSDRGPGSTRVGNTGSAHRFRRPVPLTDWVLATAVRRSTHARPPEPGDPGPDRRERRRGPHLRPRRHHHRIVHFGVGGFHRAHQAMVLDRLLQRGEAREYGICGVGVLEQDRRMAAAMDEQGGLYTLVLKHPDGTGSPVSSAASSSTSSPSTTGRRRREDGAPGHADRQPHHHRGRLHFEHVTGEFVGTSRVVAARDLRGDAPRGRCSASWSRALRRRRDRGLEPFTVMSCDNIQGNGHVARQMFTSYARCRTRRFADWMDEHVVVPELDGRPDLPGHDGRGPGGGA